MFKKILALTLCLFLFALPVSAEVQTQEIDDVPQHLKNEWNTVKPPQTNISMQNVLDEVYSLEEKLPIVKELDCNIYLVKKSYYSVIWGTDLFGTVENNNIYIFSSKYINENGNLEHSVAHEIGHAIKEKYLDYESILEYEMFRDDQKEHKAAYDAIQELYAEDFRILFGSDTARTPQYRPTYDLPGDKEKYWIINKIFEKITWQERLEFYKIYPYLAKAEITRAKQIEAQKTANGDYTGAKAAHVWANQIREVIGDG
ncbi:MAG: hypothetical protein WC834_00095 [Eubacteriales bacterium]